MEVKILGTVSPHCHKSKNCPGFLISEGSSKVLLDCGNGITSELNPEKDLENLTIIISHLHKDHYGDLLSLAYTTFVLHNLGILKEKVKVHLPKPNYKSEEDTYTNLLGQKVTKAVESTINDYRFLTNLGTEQYLEFKTYDENAKMHIGSLELEFARNPHQVTTYSTKVTTPFSSIVYSSDTGYQGNILTDFARNTDLLICETTYLKDQLRKTDNHLYTYEAGEIAKQAQPQQLLLTHFYPEISKDLYLQETKKIFDRTEVAEEGKILKLERRSYFDRSTYS